MTMMPTWQPHTFGVVGTTLIGSLTFNWVGQDVPEAASQRSEVTIVKDPESVALSNLAEIYGELMGATHALVAGLNQERAGKEAVAKARQRLTELGQRLDELDKESKRK